MYRDGTDERYTLYLYRDGDDVGWHVTGFNFIRTSNPIGGNHGCQFHRQLWQCEVGAKLGWCHRAWKIMAHVHLQLKHLSRV